MALVRQQLCRVCTCHAWSADGHRLAISPNSSALQIYAATDLEDPWQRTACLQGPHLDPIRDVDWSSAGQLITCSGDRCVVVWTEHEGTWTPARVCSCACSSHRLLCCPQRVTCAQVNLQSSLSALCVRWIPVGTHFALGSSDKCLSVGYHDAERGWWTTKLVRRRHTSSVVAVAWHPTLPCVATACTDSRCRVVGAALPGKHS